MSRYIDLDKVEFLKVDGNEEFNHGVDCCINTLLKIEPVQAIPVTDNATNGDMLKVMFPNMNVQGRNAVTFDIKGQTIELTGMALKEWWNAPYKRTEG